MTRSIFLVPGDLYAGVEPAMVSTVLGSCVAVCLWDRQGRGGAINHFLLPNRGRATPGPRYGDVAMELLIAAMETLGCRPGSLQAKVFGGSASFLLGSNAETIGGQNVRVALAALAASGIPVLARRTGGQQGLLLRFNTLNGSVMVRELPPTGATGGKPLAVGVPA